MKQETVKTIRTSVQALFAVAAVTPVLVQYLPAGVASGVGASLVAVAAIITRIHQIPEVSAALAKYLKIPE